MINLRKIRYFLAVVDEAVVTLAARWLFAAASAWAVVVFVRVGFILVAAAGLVVHVAVAHVAYAPASAEVTGTDSASTTTNEKE